jgi:2-C-methyl-D-erythritol 2,4-cyclodiphosphate synthase
MIRVGHGYDVHAFAADRALVLGGVHVPYERGLAGHSDADVLLHAICDACLGAAALGDIGRHFPDGDPAFQGIDSRILLRRVTEMLAQAGWKVGNVDATVVAQVPKLAPFVEGMRQNIAAGLGVPVEAVNVKATTTEGLSFVGREEGIAAHAVVLLSQVSP